MPQPQLITWPSDPLTPSFALGPASPMVRRPPISISSLPEAALLTVMLALEARDRQVAYLRCVGWPHEHHSHGAHT